MQKQSVFEAGGSGVVRWEQWHDLTNPIPSSRESLPTSQSTLSSISLLALRQVHAQNEAAPLNREELRIEEDEEVSSRDIGPLGLGEGNCLISRLPCNFLNTRIQRPGPNEVGMYETRFRNPDGFTLCQILARNHEVRPIQVIGSTNQVLTFFSPGLVDSPPVNYGRDIYVEYNIQCGEGRMAFLSIREMNLEPKNCQNFNDRLECVDYIRVEGGQFGNIESCGEDRSMDYNTFPRSSLRVIFRSGPQRRFPGFAAHITCFESQSMPGMDSFRKRRDGSILDFALDSLQQKQLDLLLAPHFNIAQEMAKTRPTAFDPDEDVRSTYYYFELPEEFTIPDIFPTFDSLASFTALTFENVINPVLRAAARSIIEELELKAPETLTTLRATFEAPDFVFPDEISSVLPDDPSELLSLLLNYDFIPHYQAVKNAPKTG